jgi:hypothetical protein
MNAEPAALTRLARLRREMDVDRSALEAIFERVAKLLDEEMPTSPSWHLELTALLPHPRVRHKPPPQPKPRAVPFHQSCIRYRSSFCGGMV